MLSADALLLTIGMEEAAVDLGHGRETDLLQVLQVDLQHVMAPASNRAKLGQRLDVVLALLLGEPGERQRRERLDAEASRRFNATLPSNDAACTVRNDRQCAA